MKNLSKSFEESDWSKPIATGMRNEVPILTVTLNPCIDKWAAVARVVPDRKLRCSDPWFAPGGGGINVARAIHRLGGSVEARYLAGGFAGRLLEELLDQEGIRRRGFPIAGTTRINLLVRETDTDQQFRFGMPGPKVEAEEWQSLLDALSALEPFPKFLVFSGSVPSGVPAQFQNQLADLVNRRNSRLLLDTSGEPLRTALHKGVYLVKPNLRELGQVCGEQVQQEEEIQEAAMNLVRTGQSQIVVVSLGRAGALVVFDKLARWIRAPNVPVQSMAGAGDSMMAGLALALSRGASEVEAACYGVAAGTAAVMAPRSELCQPQDTEKLYQQIISSLDSQTAAPRQT